MAKYPYKLLDCWPRLVELRRQFMKEMWTAKERGEILLMGTGAFHSLLAGLGPFHFFGGLGPNFGRIMEDQRNLVRTMETAEEKGYGPDTCSTLRATLGSMFMGFFDYNPRTRSRVKADFLLETQSCQAQGKTAQLWMEYYDIPYFLIEMPPGPERADYLVDQLQESIEFMEKVTGRKYNDEWLIESLYREWEGRVLSAKISECQKAIPAPLDHRMLWSFNTITMRGGRHRPEVLDFFRMACDEAKDRVEKGIAALATERCRLLHEGAATWYFSPILFYPTRYGALYIGSEMTFAGGAWDVQEDGTWQPTRTLQEQGREIRTREEALRALAELSLLHSPGSRSMLQLEHRVNNRLMVAQEWQAQGAVFNNDRGCRGTSVGNMESILELKRKGIPAIAYEGSVTNPRDLDFNEYISRMDAFLESLGLTPLDSVEAEEAASAGERSSHASDL